MRGCDDLGGISGEVKEPGCIQQNARIIYIANPMERLLKKITA